MAKYHINKNGTPAICKAKDGNCPLGGEGEHFDSKEEAQVEADRRGESEFGIINGVKQSDKKKDNDEKEAEEKKRTREEREKHEEKERKALFNKYKKIVNDNKKRESPFVQIKGEDLDLRTVIHPKGRNPGKTPNGYGREEGLLYIDYVKDNFHKAKSEAEDNRDVIPYYFRMKESIRLKGRFRRRGTTKHYNVDRKGRRMEVDRLIGRGKVVGNYVLHHDVSKRGGPESYVWQVAEVRDTGQITMYDERRGQAITTFIPSRARMKAIIVKAGEVPNKEFLDRVEINHRIWEKENNAEKVQKDYVDKRKGEKRRMRRKWNPKCQLENKLTKNP